MKLYSPEMLSSMLYQSPAQITSWKRGKATFYSRYPLELKNSAEATTHYQLGDTSLAVTPKQALLAHTRQLSHPTLALIGVGNFRPQSPEHRFARTIKPKRIIAIEPHAKPEGPQLNFEHYRYDITNLLPKELSAIADITTLFDSIIMDIVPGLLIAAFVHLSQITQSQGLIAFDTNLGYEAEVATYHAKYPHAPLGIFERNWESTDINHPITGKFMRINTQMLHSLAIHAGFSHIQDYHLNTRSISHGQRQTHPRLTSIWQKTSEPTPNLLAYVK